MSREIEEAIFVAASELLPCCVRRGDVQITFHSQATEVSVLIWVEAEVASIRSTSKRVLLERAPADLEAECRRHGLVSEAERGVVQWGREVRY